MAAAFGKLCNNPLLPGDIGTFLRVRESEMPAFTQSSPFLPRRQALVEWIGDLCKAFDLTRSTCHVAVYLTDIVMDTAQSTEHVRDSIIVHML